MSKDPRQGSPRYVFDTNVLVSALLFSHSTPGRAVFTALGHGVLLASEATVAELADVLSRPKFDRFVDAEQRSRFLSAFVGRAELITVKLAIQECRDPDDDKFLSLALAGGASTIISGDDDLLVLAPFRGIPILSPTAFLEAVEASG